MWQFFKNLWWLWLVLMSGIASIILGAIPAFGETPLRAVGFWLASYACLIVAGFVLWFKEYLQVKALAEKLEKQERALTADRSERAKERLASLTGKERNALNQLFIEGRMHGDRVRALLPGVDFVQMNHATPFLNHDAVSDFWVVHQDWQEVLRRLLSEEGSGGDAA